MNAREDNSMFVSHHIITAWSVYRENIRPNASLETLKYGVYGITPYLDISKLVGVIAAKHLDVKHWRSAGSLDRISVDS